MSAAGKGKRRKGKPVVEVKLNIGVKCRTCGQRFLNPFGHVCKVKFGERGKTRLEKKHGKK